MTMERTTMTDNDFTGDNIMKTQQEQAPVPYYSAEVQDLGHTVLLTTVQANFESFFKRMTQNNSPVRRKTIPSRRKSVDGVAVRDPPPNTAAACQP